MKEHIKKLLEDRYFLRDEDGNLLESSLAEVYGRVAHTIASVEKTDNEAATWELKFFNIMNRNKFLPGTPVLINSGKDNPGSFSACFVLPVEDSMEGIFDAIKNAALIHKAGGGTGFNFSHLREEGSIVASTGHKSSGPLEFMKVFNQAMDTVKQGGARRGASMGILNVDHPDILKFIRMKEDTNSLTNFNISVLVTDAFMKAMNSDSYWSLVSPKDGSVVDSLPARYIWDAIIEQAWKTGEPGVLFAENLNRDNPMPERITTTNPCWVGSTKVWTVNDGWKTFSELAHDGNDVEVFSQKNGKLITKMMRNPRKTADNARILEVAIKGSGSKAKQVSYLRCTYNHQFYLKDGSKVLAKDLKPGDSLSSVYLREANNKGYVSASFNGVSELVHNVVLQTPDGFHAHHKNKNSADNRRSNLELKDIHTHLSEHKKGSNNPIHKLTEEGRNYLITLPTNKQNNPRYKHDVSNVEIVRLRDEEKLSWKNIATKVGLAKNVFNIKRRYKWGLEELQTNHTVVSVEDCMFDSVYNGTVDDTHSYFVACGDSDGILSANCGEIPLLEYESCVAKGELVLTDIGFLPIETIKENTWVASLDNGYPCYQQVLKVKNNGIKPVYELLTKEGYRVKATEDHRFLTTNGWKQVKELQKNDELVLGARKFTEDYKENYAEWELLGWLHGDGWFTNNSVGISFNYTDGDGPIKDRLIPIFIDWLCNGKDVKPLKDDEISFQLQTELSSAKEALENYGCKLGIASERELPTTIWEQEAEAQASFLRGYIAADGGVQGKANSQYKIASANRKMLEQVQLLLTRFDIGSYISTCFMENHENRNPQHQLVITGEDAQVLFHRIGFISDKKALKFNTDPKVKYGKRETVRVLSITHIGEEEVFDIEVAGTHNFIVNGLVAHNCNLGSINLMSYYKDGDVDYDALIQDIPTMVRFLDNVIDANTYILPEIEAATKATRKIGLGVMGWADLLIVMKIKYDSDEAIALAEYLMDIIDIEAEKASRKLAEEKGSFPAWEISKYATANVPIRNATTLCVAPTGTISRIAGVSSGIEPIFAWQTHHKLSDREYTETHWAYEENLEGDKLPEYMVTASEIAPEWHLEHQAVFQKHIDNSVSKTINLPAMATIDDVNDLLKGAYNLGIKGITVYRDGCRVNQPLTKVNDKLEDYPFSPHEEEIFGKSEIADIIRAENKLKNLIVVPEFKEYRSRPAIVFGPTYKVDTGKGKMYVTVNYTHGEDTPVEVFLRMGHKSTGTEHELAEWSGRLISLLLKHNVPMEDILRQSTKVLGDNGFFFDKRSFRSLPQLVGHLIELDFADALEKMELEDGIIKFEADFSLPEVEKKNSDRIITSEYCYECGNYGIVNEGGCKVCTNCGDSKCG